MAEREKDKRLEEMKEDGWTFYSISKLNTIDQCLLQAKLNYIDKVPSENNVYGILGTKIHEVLEGIYNNQKTNDDLLPALETELFDLDMLGIDFPRDFKGGDSIRQSWIRDMTEFCKHHNKLNGDFTTEELFIFPVGEKKAMMGYIDLLYFRKPKEIEIYDFKTSSNFNKKDLIHHGRQLVVYAMAKELEGYKVDKVAWIMLKYLEVTIKGKRKDKVKVINRGKLFKELRAYVYDLLLEEMDELSAELLVDELIERNAGLEDFYKLPKCVTDNIIIKDYIREYPYDEETKKEALEYINKQISRFENAQAENKFPSLEINKSSSFFCNVLCGFRNTCPALLEYRLQQEFDKREK